jgi:hypothetical protein
MLYKYHEYIPEAYTECEDVFYCQLSDLGVEDVDEKDLYSKIVKRWCQHLKLTFIKVPKYASEKYTINGLVEPFSKKDIKWFKPILSRRVENEVMSNITDEQISDLLYWVAIRYNFWLLEGMK